MSNENELEQQTESTTDASAEAGADDLTDALGAPTEAGFVSSEKKPIGTGTIIMAGFLLACGAGTYFMYHRNANANTTPSAESAAAQTTITQFLSDDKENINKMKDLLQNTEKAVQQFRESPGKKQIPVDELQTNPFRFAPEKPEDGVPADKFAAEKKAAEALTLQFVMSGKRKSCMINNATYREGQTVGDFTVESITTGEVIVRKGDLRFKLQMKSK